MNAKALDNIILAMTKKECFENNYTNVPKVKFRDLEKILGSTKELLLTEPMLAMGNTPRVFVGDIHGQYGDLLNAFTIVRSRNKDSVVSKGNRRAGFVARNFTFLGNYVDGGPCGVECVTLLCLLKLRYPTHYTLLRGNHESRDVNRTNGFHAEIMQKYPDEDEAVKLYEMFNEVFDCLPLAALLCDCRILCMHGGISKSIDKLEQINEIRRPLPDPLSNNIARDLLWADPVYGIKGYEPNAIRGVADSFGEDVLQEFLAKHDLKMIVRGHQKMKKGVAFFSDLRLVTIFTATANYPGVKEPTIGAVMLMSNKGEFGFRLMATFTNDEPKGYEWFTEYYDNEDNDNDYRVVKRA